MPTTINSFAGPFAFLSNFSSSPISIGGLTFPTVEHAFAAAKTLDSTKRVEIAAAPTPGKAKRLGRKVALRPHWDDMRVSMMTRLVRLKFQEPTLRAQLLATGDALLVEGNRWNDVFWGVCNGVGENQLGQILMRVRTEARGADRERNWTRDTMRETEELGAYESPEFSVYDVVR
jgi:ribA/ribD-fused uncharacterized protein